MIKALLIILLLTGCAADKKHSERWIASLETLPRVKGYVVTGIFELGKNLYAQHCDSKGMDWAILAWDIDQYIRNRLKYQTEKLDTLSAKKELEFLREALNEMLIDKGLQYPT